MFSTTMFAKEKAIELYNKFYEPSVHNNSVQVRKDLAKKFSLIAVEIAVIELAFVIPIEAFKFWEQVKLEIEMM
ncbi:MAG: hypothetical protein ABI237_06115 [Ginsengibacter sp.]